MFVRILKPIFRVFLFLIVLGIIISAAFAVWVSTGQRTVPYLANEFAVQIETAIPGVDVKTDRALIKWRGFEDGLGIYISNLNISDYKGESIASFPAVYVRLEIWQLFLGVVRFEDMSVEGAMLQLDIAQILQKLNEIEQADHNVTADKNDVKLLSKILNSNKEVMPISLISFKDMRILIRNGREDIVWHIESFKTGFNIKHGKPQIPIVLESSRRNNSYKILANIFSGDSGEIVADAQIKGLPAHLLVDILPELDWLYESDIRLNGNVSVYTSSTGTFETLEYDFILNDRDFLIRHSKNELIKKKQFIAKATGYIEAKEGSAKPYIYMNGQIANLPMGDLRYYWPKKFFPEVQRWVTDRVIEGTYTFGSIILDMQPQDWDKKTRRRKMLTSVVDFEGGKNTYLEGFPVLEGASGSAIFDPFSADINIYEGKILDRTVKNSRVYITKSKKSNQPSFGISLETSFDKVFVDEYISSPIDLLEGELQVLASLNGEVGDWQLKTKIDGKNAALKMPIIGWEKPISKSFSFESNGNIDGKNFLDISEIKLISEGLNISAIAGLDFSRANVWHVDLNDLRFKNSHGKLLVIKKGSEKIDISADMKEINLEPILNSLGNDKSIGNMPIEFNLLSKNAKLSKDVQVQNLKVDIDCDDKCDFVSVEGDVKDGRLEILYDLADKNTPKESAFLAKLKPAGEFLAAFGIAKSMFGGTAEVSAHRNDKGQLIHGKIWAKDVIVKKAPLLTKILTIGSLTGVLNNLSGKGIIFEKAKGEFSVDGGLINLHKFHVSGDAIGLTAKGKINLSEDNLDLEGNVIPSYALNTLLDKVPLVGNLLTGGKGQGLFALRYKMEENLEEPKITVNPLSALTPGFLKKIWDAGG